MDFLIGALLLAGLAASLPAQELTLDQCLQLALTRSPALAGAAAKTRESQADFKAALAPRRTTLSATAIGTQLNENRLSPVGAGLPQGGNLYTTEGFAGLTAHQLLYDGGRSKSALDVAARGLDVQREGLAAIRDETLMRVTQAFYRALATAELVGVARDAVNRDQAFEATATGLFEAGKVTRLDALKAAAAHVEAERVLTTAEATAALAVIQLAQTMGVDGLTGLAPRGALPTDLAGPPARDDAIAAAIAQSPDLRRSTYELEQARTSLHLARGGYSPAIALQAGYGFRERDVGGGRPEWLIGFNANWSLFDGGAVSAQVSKAQARATQAEEARRSLALDLNAQVYDALAAWRVALSDARAAARLVETGCEAVAAAEALYRSGKVTALDVLTAQSDLARAEGAKVSAAAAYALARAQLARLTGATFVGTTR